MECEPTAGTCRELWLSDKTVESHVRAMSRSLGLGRTRHTHGRVQAVLAWVEASQRASGERRTEAWAAKTRRPTCWSSGRLGRVAPLPADRPHHRAEP